MTRGSERSSICDECYSLPCNCRGICDCASCHYDRDVQRQRKKDEEHSRVLQYGLMRDGGVKLVDAIEDYLDFLGNPVGTVSNKLRDVIQEYKTLNPEGFTKK